MIFDNRKKHISFTENDAPEKNTVWKKCTTTKTIVELSDTRSRGIVFTTCKTFAYFPKLRTYRNEINVFLKVCKIMDAETNGKLH